jgi:hypothetical protein
LASIDLKLLFCRVVELATGVGDLRVRDPFERFEKEDMSDMFKRAMLEKMQLVGEIFSLLLCFSY